METFVLKINVIQIFSLLLICSGNLSLEKSKHKKPFDWLPDQGWEDLVKLAELFPELFSSLPDDVERNESEWKSVSHCSGKSRTNTNVSTFRAEPLFFVSSVVWLGWTRTSSVSHEVHRDPNTLSEAAAAALLPSWSGLQSRDWLHNCCHGWEVRPPIETDDSSQLTFIRPSLKRKIRSEHHCSFNLLSAQVCSATCYQLWCYLRAEHTFFPHHIHPEPRLWSHQRPCEISREVWIWR